MFIDIGDVDHNCGHVTEGRRTFPAALDGQEVLGVCLKVQAFVDIQDPWWGGWAGGEGDERRGSWEHKGRGLRGLEPNPRRVSSIG